MDSANVDEQSSTTSVDATPQPPADAPAKTDQDTVNQWLRQRYLAYELEDGAEAIVTIGEFLNIVRTEYPECYMPEHTVTLALALAVKKWKRSNTIVISDLHAQRLYALGTGTDTQAEVFRSCPTLQQTLLDPQRRWIIIPCSDGVMKTTIVGERYTNTGRPSKVALAAPSRTPNPGPVSGEERPSGSQVTIDTHGDSETAAPQKEQTNKQRVVPKETTKKSYGPEQYGAHWGLLIIDKVEKVARWVDSVTTLVESPNDPNKGKFEHMHPAARAAGKILCGFDTLLGEENGFPPGGFTTSTLKYNPNQWKDNSCQGDGGPCGPFMFAFLKYILERATTLDRVGVSKMFPRRQRGKIKFDSVEARQEIRRLIQQEGEKPDDMPFGLSLDLLRILLPVEQLQRSVDVYLGRAVAPSGPVKKRPAFNRSTRLPQDLPSDPAVFEAFEQAKLIDPDTYKDLPDGEAWALFCAIQRSALNSQDNRPAGGGNSNGSEPGGKKPNTTDFYLGQDQYRNVPLDDLAIWPQHDIDPEKMPGRIKRLPDFTVVLDPTVAAWFNKSPELHDQVNKKRLSGHWRYTARALLHLKFKKTFLGESDNNFERTWSKDRAVFNPQDTEVKRIQKIENTKTRFGTMRLRMMRHYQGAEAVDALLKTLEKYKHKAPVKGKKDKKGKADRDDKEDPSSSDSEDGQDKPNGRSNPNRPSDDGAPNTRPDNGDLFNNEYQNGPEPNVNGGTSDNDTALEHSTAFQAIAGQVIEFAPMNEEDINKWFNKTASHGFLNSTARLWEKKMRLQRAFGGFSIEATSKETAADYRTHLDLDDTLGLMQIINAITQRTNDVPDLRGQIQWYPDYFLREHGVISVEDDNQGAVKHNKASNGASANKTSDNNNDSENNARAETNAGIDDNTGADTNTGATIDVGTGINAGGSANTGSVKNAGPVPDAQVITDAGANTTAGGVTNAEGNDSVSHSSTGINSPSLTTPMLQGLWNFRTMNEEELMTHVTPEMRNDPRVTNIRHGDVEAVPDATSWRAMCFVDISKGRFDTEDDAACMELWHNDPLVFNDIQRAMKSYESRIVKEMMADHYYRKDWSKHDTRRKEQQGLDLTQDDDYGDIFNQFSDDEEEEDENEESTEEDPNSPDPPADSPQAPTSASNTNGVKRKYNGSEDLLAKKRRQPNSNAQQQRGLQALREASETIQHATDCLRDTGFAAGFHSSGSDTGAQATAGAPDGGDGGGSPPESPLTTPLDSSVSPDSSGSEEDDSDPSNKRRRDSEDDDPEGEGSPSKKPKTGGNQGQSVSSPETGSTNGQGDPEGQTTNKEPTSNSPVNASFDSQATVEDPTIEIYIGRQPYILDLNDSSIFLPEDTSGIDWPTGATSLPDFAHLQAPALLLWRRNLDLNFPNSSYTTNLALMHMKFKRTLLYEPDENFSDVWINDGSVFTAALRASLRAIPDARFRNGEIRRRMMEAYEPDILNKIEAMPKPKLVNPKITIQAGTFEVPESFKSDVHPGETDIKRRVEKESVDESRLSPRAARTTKGKARYGLREKPKPSKKKRGE